MSLNMFLKPFLAQISIQLVHFCCNGAQSPAVLVVWPWSWEALWRKKTANTREADWEEPTASRWADATVAEACGCTATGSWRYHLHVWRRHRTPPIALSRHDDGAGMSWELVAICPRQMANQKQPGGLPWHSATCDMWHVTCDMWHSQTDGAQVMEALKAPTPHLCRPCIFCGAVQLDD